MFSPLDLIRGADRNVLDLELHDLDHIPAHDDPDGLQSFDVEEPIPLPGKEAIPRALRRPKVRQTKKRTVSPGEDHNGNRRSTTTSLTGHQELPATEASRVEPEVRLPTPQRRAVQSKLPANVLRVFQHEDSSDEEEEEEEFNAATRVFGTEEEQQARAEQKALAAQMAAVSAEGRRDKLQRERMLMFGAALGREALSVIFSSKGLDDVKWRGADANSAVAIEGGGSGTGRGGDQHDVPAAMLPTYYPSRRVAEAERYFGSSGDSDEDVRKASEASTVPRLPPSMWVELLGSYTLWTGILVDEERAEFLDLYDLFQSTRPGAYYVPEQIMTAGDELRLPRPVSSSRPGSATAAAAPSTRATEPAAFGVPPVRIMDPTTGTPRLVDAREAAQHTSARDGRGSGRRPGSAFGSRRPPSPYNSFFSRRFMQRADAVANGAAAGTSAEGVIVSGRGPRYDEGEYGSQEHRTIAAYSPHRHSEAAAAALGLDERIAGATGAPSGLRPSSATARSIAAHNNPDGTTVGGGDPFTTLVRSARDSARPPRPESAAADRPPRAPSTAGVSGYGRPPSARATGGATAVTTTVAVAVTQHGARRTSFARRIAAVAAHRELVDEPAAAGDESLVQAAPLYGLALMRTTLKDDYDAATPNRPPTSMGGAAAGPRDNNASPSPGPRGGDGAAGYGEPQAPAPAPAVVPIPSSARSDTSGRASSTPRRALSFVMDAVLADPEPTSNPPLPELHNLLRFAVPKAKGSVGQAFVPLDPIRIQRRMLELAEADARTLSIIHDEHVARQRLFHRLAVETKQRRASTRVQSDGRRREIERVATWGYIDAFAARCVALDEFKRQERLEWRVVSRVSTARRTVEATELEHRTVLARSALVQLTMLAREAAEGVDTLRPRQLAYEAQMRAALDAAAAAASAEAQVATRKRHAAELAEVVAREVAARREVRAAEEFSRESLMRRAPSAPRR